MARTKELVHRIMSSIRSNDTKPEQLLRKELWSRGLRYKKNVKSLPGKPDIVFSKARLIVFCDGDYWHGHNWALRGYDSLEEELSRYSDYWSNKIRRNVARDKAVTKELTDNGWTVIRLWTSDIEKAPKKCGDKIEYMYWNNMRNQKKDYNYEERI